MNVPALIHIIPSIGPVGIWRPENDVLHAYYPNDPDGAHRARAQAALDARGNNIDWATWFEQLTDRTPYFDDYITLTTNPTETLPTVLAWVEQLWTDTP